MAFRSLALAGCAALFLASAFAAPALAEPVANRMVILTELVDQPATLANGVTICVDQAGYDSLEAANAVAHHDSGWRQYLGDSRCRIYRNRELLIFSGYAVPAMQYDDPTLARVTINYSALGYAIMWSKRPDQFIFASR